MRNSFSKFKKDLKQRLKGKKREPGDAGANIAEEGANSSGLLLQPDPPVATSGYKGEGTGTSTDAWGTRSGDRSPQPESTQVGKGRDDPRKKETGVSEKEVSQNHPHGKPDAAEQRGSSRVDPSPPDSLIPHKVEPGGTLIVSPRRKCLTVLSDNADTLAASDQDLGPSEGAKPSGAANEKKSNWKATTLATAKLLLRGVRDSADAFGPLKSVAGGLCFILENCEVWTSPHLWCRNSHGYTRE